MKKEIAYSTKSFAWSGALSLSLSLSLSLLACTRNWSLGAAGDGDGGSAERTIIRQPGDAFGDRAFNYPAGSPEVALFRYHLAAVGELAAVGDPSSSISTESCAKSVSFGTTTKVQAGAVTSGDLQCLISPTAAQTALAHDADVLTGMVSPTFLTTANLCIATLGTISSQLVCTGARSDFPDTCLIGVCSPQNSQTMVTTCVCPGGGCFTPPYGCVGRPGTCDIGDDQTCNDDIGANAFHGTCLPGRSCACSPGFALVAASGKCS